jgi:hypothetical protein
MFLNIAVDLKPTKTLELYADDLTAQTLEVREEIRQGEKVSWVNSWRRIDQEGKKDNKIRLQIWQRLTCALLSNNCSTLGKDTILMNKIPHVFCICFVLVFF